MLHTSGGAYMESTRIKVKIGDFEFDAEGPVETVHAQFEAFKQIISLPSAVSTPAKTQNTEKPVENRDESQGPPHVPIEKIMHAAGRVVSLTALPASTVDAALLVMLGHKDLRNNVSVTGQEIG